MSENKKKTEEFDRCGDWEQNTYQTGSTQPPKKQGGLIAFLLGLVIFLCGISTALGLMNIRLFRSLQEESTWEETNPVSLSQGASQSQGTYFPLGFSGQEIPELWCVYQELPHGIYITHVDQNSDAAQKGVLPGDILLKVDGQAVSSADSLEEMLEQHHSSSAQVAIYRDGQQLEMTLSLQKP